MPKSKRGAGPSGQLVPMNYVESSKTAKPKLTLAELVNMRVALPPMPPAGTANGSLSERFLVPPFSVLDARQGYWQRRKKMWLELGIQSELGRGENNDPNTHPIPDGGAGKNSARMFRGAGGYVSDRQRRANATVTGSPMPATRLGADGRTQRGDGRGTPLGKPKKSPNGKGIGRAFNCSMQPAVKDEDNEWGTQDNLGSGTSIFDPVLCELAYRWFCPKGGRVLDPFAGGSVRGIVAARLGRSYAGVDLRPEQAEANAVQGAELCPDANLTWAVGDAKDVVTLVPGEYDFLFSCPPYADLERYSNDPRDLSTMPYPQFLEAYRSIVASSCAMLREDRFACFVVGDIRDLDTGNYRNFVGDTVQAFRDAGLELYNDAVLVTQVGSLSIRVGYQFGKYRKLGKTHQNVLVFVKGDWAKAASACGEVDVDDLLMPDPRPGYVALCLPDVLGTVAEDYLTDEGLDAPLVELPLMEACLLCDVVRGQARLADTSLPRCWVGTESGWRRVTDNEELTYVVGGVPYLNRTVFPSAATPPVAPPPFVGLGGVQ